MATNETYISGQLFSKSISSISKTLSINRLPPEVLDDCRKDPAMPKRVLIDIAQKEHGESGAVKRFEAVYAPELVGGEVVFTDYEMIAGKREGR